MAKSYKTNSKSNEISLGRQAEGDHLFVAEGVSMQSLALPSFDTDSFKYWVAESNFDAFVPNDAYLVDPESEIEVLVEDGIYNTILAYNDAKDGTGSTPSREDGFINITAWRTKGRNGQYEFYQKFSDWEFEDLYSQIDPAQPGRIWTSSELNLLNVPIEGDVAVSDSSVGQQTFLEYIIALNAHINSLLIQDPTGQDTTIWNIEDRLRREFLVDVMSSKQGCINWTAQLKFRTQGVEKTEQGQIKKKVSGEKIEETNFRLYLFSIAQPIEVERKVSLKNFDVIGKRSHYGAGDFLQSEDGKIFGIPDIYNPKAEVAGELSLSYTDFLGKFESGTPQMIAVMSTDLRAAEGVSIESLESDSVDTILDHTDGQEIIFGSAIPIHMQNTNPRQWAPVYNTHEENRKADNFAKSHIKVANLSPTNFTRGDMVVLNRIEGVWFPFGIVSSGDVAGGGVTVVENRDPKWEFMYLITNQEWHFKDANGESVTPDEYEKGFYYKYYEGDIFTENSERYESSFISKISGPNEFYQVTSWDFMGDSIGGTRTKKGAVATSRLQENYFFPDEGINYLAENLYLETPAYIQGENGNALSNTDYFRDVQDKDYEDSIRNTYPFFGCVFPDGYSSTSDFVSKMNTNSAGEGTYFSTVLPRYKGREYLHFLPVSGNVLENNNDVVGISPASDAHQKLGMFKDVNATALKHLPADIATNASMVGKNGYPITDATIFDITDDKKNPNRTSFSDDIHNFIFASGDKLGAQDRYGWVFERKVEILSDPSGQKTPQVEEFNNSAYDLQPTRFTRLQFRPLTKELYSFLERSNIGTTNPGGDAKTYDGFEFDLAPPPATNLGAIGQPGGTYEGRGVDSERLWQGAGYNSPISTASVRRNLLRLEEPSNPHHFGLEQSPQNSLVGKYGLKYGSDLPQFVEAELEQDKDNGYPYLWYAGPNYRWSALDGNLSLGGIGIIGATMSLRSLGTLSISTENVHLEDFGIAGGGTQRSLNLGNFDEPNTTDLFMRCYKRWPRELTIYDPRYFVVHHFNQGVGPAKQSFDIATIASGVIISDFSNNLSDITLASVNERLRADGLILEDETLQKGYADPSGWFPIRKKIHDVDIKVVTKWNSGLADINEKIYGDATIYTGDVGVDNKVREKDDWWYNPTRRGKLLPYSYKYRTIGVKADNVVTINLGDELQANAYDIIIVDGGGGYSVGEEFTVVGGTGGGVILKIPEGGVNDIGEITSLVNRSDNDQGLSYAPEDFRNQAILDTGEWKNNTIIYPDDPEVAAPIISKLSVQPLTQGEKPPQGEGLIAYVVRGTVVFSPLLTDPKPAEPLDVTGPIRLSPFSRDNLSSNASNTFQINNPDEDNSYDLFFRYHNDISHVGIDSNGSPNVPQAREQMITLTINNNIGLGAGAGDDINWGDPFTDFGGGGGGDDSFFDFFNNCNGDGAKAGGARGDASSFGFDQC